MLVRIEQNSLKDISIKNVYDVFCGIGSKSGFELLHLSNPYSIGKDPPEVLTLIA